MEQISKELRSLLVQFEYVFHEQRKSVHLAYATVIVVSFLCLSALGATLWVMQNRTETLGAFESVTDSLGADLERCHDSFNELVIDLVELGVLKAGASSPDDPPNGP